MLMSEGGSPLPFGYELYQVHQYLFISIPVTLAVKMQ